MVRYLSQYIPLDNVDDDEKLSGDATRFDAEPRPKSRTLRLWLTHGILICTTVFSFTLWMRTPPTYLRNDIPSIYSPASVAVEPVIVKFNGSPPLKESLPHLHDRNTTPSPGLSSS